MRRALTRYITSAGLADNTTRPASSPWPLIKEVKIRCSAEVLITGSILVDLPGTNDSNAARSSVSEAHIQNCDRVWITAEATRAVSDQSASGTLCFISHLRNLSDHPDLISNALRRQLKS